MSLFSLPPLFPPTPPREEATPEEIRVWHFRLTSFLGSLPRLLEESMEAFNDFPNMRDNSITLQTLGTTQLNLDLTTTAETSSLVSVTSGFDTGQLQLTAITTYNIGNANAGNGTIRMRSPDSAGAVIGSLAVPNLAPNEGTQMSFSALDTPVGTSKTYVVTMERNGTVSVLTITNVELKVESFKK